VRSGNFLVRILQRKLAAVELKFSKSNFEKRHYALLALMCSYGIATGAACSPRFRVAGR
jgi:hypothetical protein